MLYYNHRKGRKTQINQKGTMKMKNMIEQKVEEIRAMNDWRTVTALTDEEVLALAAEELKMDLEDLKALL